MNCNRNSNVISNSGNNCPVRVSSIDSVTPYSVEIFAITRRRWVTVGDYQGELGSERLRPDLTGYRTELASRTLQPSGVPVCHRPPNWEKG